MGEKITRKQACQRLIRSAIISFVRDDEPLSTHLCLQAAFRVCRDIVKKRNKSLDWFEQLVRPERFREFLNYHSKLSRFLKHADKSPIEEIDLHDLRDRNMHELLLVNSYYALAFPGPTDPYMHSYNLWMFKKFPEAMLDNEMTARSLEALNKATLEQAWTGLVDLVNSNLTEIEEYKKATPAYDW